jgi:hypothetical protein
MNYYEPRELEIRLSMHEEICAERYGKLYAVLEENRKELKELRQLASMGNGAWKAVVGLGIILTLIFTFLKLTFIHFKE